MKTQPAHREDRRIDSPSVPLRLLFIVTEDWYFVLHWLELAKAAKKAGYAVGVATRAGKEGDQILASGLELIPLARLRRSSVNPVSELAAVTELVGVVRRWRPDIVHLVALKPIIYGAIALSIGHRVPSVNALAGLGFVFLQTGGLARVLRPPIKRLLRLALGRRGSLTTVQNPDDATLLVGERLVEAENVRLIRGAGVDLRRFAQMPLPEGRPLVLLMCRMLWDKGVQEFVHAARIVGERGIDARFVLVGEPDNENPAAVPRSMLQRWNDEGQVEWWGYRSDPASVLAQATLVVLPSYREGLPTVLTEASAVGRPLIATDVPGCREVVRSRVNGLLVPARDALRLADSICELLADCRLCAEMGQRARELAERDFSIEAVVRATLEVYRELIAS